jgi:transcriptional regulator with PAS, ATPase and Fis domain
MSLGGCNVNISKLPIRESQSQDFLNDYAHAIFESMPKGVIIVDSSGEIKFANSTYCEYFGELKHAMIKERVSHHRHDNLLLKALKSGKAMEGDVHTDLCSFHAEINPIYDASLFVGVIAYYKKADKKLIQISHPPENNIENPFPRIIGQNQRLIKELQIAKRVAKADVSVLIRGESGTGKELVARSMHEAANDSDRPWVAINCAAIPENLIESELFGHEAGAFTGAMKRKIGKIELADQGTLFLDEIGDLPLHLQVKLLRVLQEREYSRVGGNEILTMNARIIAATHRNLESMVEKGLFREDLYYRLNIVEIQMIPLRERQDDIPLLICNFTKKIAEKYQLDQFEVSEEVVELLKAYAWKGNIRELKNILERSIILSDGKCLTLTNFDN